TYKNTLWKYYFNAIALCSFLEAVELLTLKLIALIHRYVEVEPFKKK
ncbi:28950_t:CDS:1, partial [Gigaspora margarita]